MRPLSQDSSHTTKLPRAILCYKGPIAGSQPSDLLANAIFAFPPNRDTLGGTSYLIVRNESNILIDSPALEKPNQDFLIAQGGVQRLFLTHRGAIGKAEEIQKIFNCEVLIQEQEAYLLPGLSVTTFSNEFSLDSEIKLIWTPGHSPGSSCLYYSNFGGVLFSGRHIIPDLQGKPALLRTAKTFHWRRQVKVFSYY